MAWGFCPVSGPPREAKAVLQPEQCRGIWVPLVTPFDGEQLAAEWLGGCIDWLLERGVGGFLALGTTGEAAHCSDDEAELLVRVVHQAVRGRVPVFAGSGRASTHGTIALTRRLAAAGADAALVLTPHAYRARMDDATLRRHYTALADASPVPIFVYHMPEVTGLELAASTLIEILQHPNVWGFKDSSAEGGPLAATLAVTRTCGFVGSGARVVEAFEAGAGGGILAVAHVVPEVAVELASAWKSGDRTRAERLQAGLRGVATSWKGYAVPGVKYALRKRGLRAGNARQPLGEVPAEQQARIDAALDAALGLL